MLGELGKLKAQLDNLEKTLGDKIDKVVDLEGKWQSYEERAREVENTKEEDIITINVGGKKFASKIDTLLKVRDNLFHKILTSGKLDIRKGIFIDRNPTYFPILLEYFRSGKFNPDRYTADQLIEIKEEILYYEILPLEDMLEKKADLVLSYSNIEVSAWYQTGGTTLGSQDPKVLLDENLTTGICVNSPAWMILWFNQECEFNEIFIGGFTGASDWIYSTGYGSGARIETSLDKKNWTFVGTVPSGFGQTIISQKVTKSKARYLKLSGTDWLGIGYLKVKLT